MLGPISTHGLTVSDVAGSTAVVVAGLRLWPPWPHRSASWIATRAAIVVVLAGLAVDTDAASPDGPQRSSLDIRRSASGLPPV